MECTLREFDQALIRGLRSSDLSIRNQCAYRIFYEDLAPLLHQIQQSLFKGNIQYDDLVDELYLYLAQNNWKILDSFQGRNGARLCTWLSHVAWHYFLYSHQRAERIEYVDDLAVIEHRMPTISVEEMRMDIEHTLQQMKGNERYVAVIRLSIIEGRKSEEVAKLLNTSVQNVYNLKHRAIAKFLKLYDERP